MQLPIVSTNVGDVESLLNKIEGCYLTEFDPRHVASCLKKAIELGQRTKGRQKIIETNLDTVSVSQKIIRIYSSLLK